MIGQGCIGALTVLACSRSAQVGGSRGGTVAETLAELRQLPEDEIVRRHDAIAANTGVGTNHYLQEIARRDAALQGDRIEKLTATMARLTWVITILTAINVVAALAAVWLALR